LDEKKEKIKLEERLKKIQDQKPKLDLSFENKEKIFELKNKFFEMKLSSRGKDILAQNMRGGIKILSEIIRKPDNIIEEIKEEFIPLTFWLNNYGNYKATNFIIDIDFPKEIIILEDLPKKESRFISSISSPFGKKDYGGFLNSKGHLRLYGDKTLSPTSINFGPFYVSSRIKGKFKIKYVINAEELGAGVIKGELIIKTDPREEIVEYINKERLEEDKDKYDKIIKEYSEGDDND